MDERKENKKLKCNNTVVNITSDSHLYHKKVIKYCNRPFKTLDEMHHHIIVAWNSVVKPDEIVIHLGDYICGGSFDEIKEITDQLNGFKILIMGNHDRKSKTWFRNIGFDRVFKYRWSIGMYCFSHRPQDSIYLTENNIRYNLHGHSHKYDYGDPFYNFCVDVVGYKPKRVEVNLSKEDLMNGVDRYFDNEKLDD